MSLKTKGGGKEVIKEGPPCPMVQELLLLVGQKGRCVCVCVGGAVTKARGQPGSLPQSHAHLLLLPALL